MIDPRIPMMVQQPNVLAALDAGTTAATNQNALMRTMEGQNLFRQHGAGAMQGNQNALAAIAGFDPTISQGIQANSLDMDATRLDMSATRQRMGFAAEEMQMLRAETARAVAEAENKAEAESQVRMLEKAFRAADMGMRTGDMAAVRQAMTMFGLEELGPEEGMQAAAQILTGGIEGLAGNYLPKEPGPGERYKAVGGQLVDLYAEGGPAPVAGIEGRSAGLSITTPDGMVISQGGPVVLDRANLQTGSGQTRIADPTSPTGTRIVPEPGSEAAAAARAGELAVADYNRKADIVDANIDRAITMLDESGRWVAGWGSTLSGIPESASRDFAATLDTIKANLGFEELQQMRDSSPTGGALGQVTERELAFLQAVQGNLDAAQSPEQVRRILVEVQTRRRQFREERERIMRGGASAAGFSGASMQDLMAVDLSTLPADQLDAWEQRLNELQGQQ